MFTVSYDVYACDDGCPERVTREFANFFEACDYFTECQLTEDNCVISAVQPEEDDDLPF